MRYYIFDAEQSGEFFTIDASNETQAFRKWAKKFLGPKATKDDIEGEAENLKANCFIANKITDIDKDYIEVMDW